MAGGNDPCPVLAEYEVFDELGKNADFAALLEQLLQQMDNSGVKATLNAYVNNRVGA